VTKNTGKSFLKIRYEKVDFAGYKTPDFRAFERVDKAT
jgi:hypothetical protein